MFTNKHLYSLCRPSFPRFQHRDSSQCGLFTIEDWISVLPDTLATQTPDPKKLPPHSGNFQMCCHYSMWKGKKANIINAGDKDKKQVWKVNCALFSIYVFSESSGGGSRDVSLSLIYLFVLPFVRNLLYESLLQDGTKKELIIALSKKLWHLHVS